MNRQQGVRANQIVTRKKDAKKDIYESWQRSRVLPDCCRVSRTKTKSLVRKLLGKQEVDVTLILDRRNPGDRYLPFTFDVCGRLLSNEFGFKLESSGDVTTSNYEEFIRRN